MLDVKIKKECEVFCKECGSEINDNAVVCLKCGCAINNQPQPSNTPIGENAGVRMLLPIGRSGWAIAAGYLGLFSVIIIPAPLALIVSIIAIIDIKKSENTKHPKHGLGRAIFGLIMGANFSSIGVMIFVNIWW
jgi:hypothetical protein